VPALLLLLLLLFMRLTGSHYMDQAESGVLH
jgi:hypothetical protein